MFDKANDAVLRSPLDAEARFVLGNIYEAYAFMELAQQCYEQALSLDPNNARVWFHLAIMRAELGDIRGAIDAMQECVDRDSSYAPAHWRLGFWQIDLDQLDAAEQAFRAAIQTDSRDPVGHIGLARLHLRRGKNREAADVLEPLIARTPYDLPAARLTLARAYARMGRLDESQSMLDNTSASTTAFNDPWQYEVVKYRVDATWQHEYAKVLASRGETAAALATMNDLLRRQPDQVEWLETLASIQRQAGQLNDALLTLQRAMKLNSQRHSLHYLFGLTMAESIRGRSDIAASQMRGRAVDHLRLAAKLNPARADALGLAGRVLADVGELHEAFELYRDAQLADGGNPVWPYRLGQIAVTQQRWEDAISHLQRATQLQSIFADAWRLLAQSYRALGRSEDAALAQNRADELASETQR